LFAGAPLVLMAWAGGYCYFSKRGGQAVMLFADISPMLRFAQTVRKYHASLPSIIY
jgi:hypothetical protein